MPVSYARTTTWTRSRRSSLVRIRPTCVFTVASATNRFSAISEFDMPCATSSMPSRSRYVSAASRPPAPPDGPVALLADHLHVRPRGQHRPEPGPYERLIVDDHDADCHATPFAGTTARTCQPPPSRGPALNSPPCTETRSRIPIRPCPPEPPPV